MGLVGYENEDIMTDVGRDGFGYEAIVDDNTSSGLQHFDISIYPEAYWTPLLVSVYILHLLLSDYLIIQ